MKQRIIYIFVIFSFIISCTVLIVTCTVEHPNKAKYANEIINLEMEFYFQELQQSCLQDGMIWLIRDQVNNLLENLDNLSDKDCAQWIRKLELADSIYSH